ALPVPRWNDTANPPVVSWVPVESRVVRVTVVEPPLAINVGESVTRDWDRLAVPEAAVTAIVGSVVVTGWPPMVAATGALPALVGVNVAVYVPSPLSVAVVKSPVAVAPVPRVKATAAPPEVNGVPLASSAVRVTVLVWLVAIVVGFAV